MLEKAVPKKIKILYVMDYYYSPFGGTEGQLYNLISKLNRKRFEVELCLFRRFSFEPDIFEKNTFPCDVQYLDFYSLYFLLDYLKLFRLRKYIKQRGFDIVQVLFNDAAKTVPLMCAGLRVKVITTRRDMGFWYTHVNLPILRVNSLFVDRYLVNSFSVRENVQKKEHVTEQRIVVIYNGHDMERFDVRKRDNLHKELSIPEGSKVVGIVANFRPVKRIIDLIVAFPEVLKKIPDCYLFLIGDLYDSKKKCIDLVKSLGIEPHVMFFGKVHDVVPLIKHFAVGVNCSESEGLSNSIIEYMGCGVPVVCSDTSGNRELVEVDKTGLLYPVGNTGALGSCIVRMLGNSDLRRHLAENARQLVEFRFEQNRIIGEYERLYTDLAS